MPLTGPCPPPLPPAVLSAAVSPGLALVLPVQLPTTLASAAVPHSPGAISPSARHRKAKMLLQAPPSHILPHLFLGAKKDAEDRELMQRLGITSVLNVTPDCPNYHEDLPGFRYKQLPVRRRYPICLGSALQRHHRRDAH